MCTYNPRSLAMSVTPSLKQEYDLIIVGGGTCGLIVASRLATADPNLSILVLEAGPPTQNQMAHVQPARYLQHLAPTANTVRFHTANPSPALGNRPFVTPCGQCIGGGSSVNFTMYTRAAASDYDDWEQMYENPGWGSKDLIPLLKKVRDRAHAASHARRSTSTPADRHIQCETYQIKKGALNHGDEGPLKVSWGGKYTNIGQDYLATARKYDVNRNPGNEDTDVNDLATVNTYGVRRLPQGLPVRDAYSPPNSAGKNGSAARTGTARTSRTRISTTANCRTCTL
jgi:alcohol oxidase